MTGGAQWEVVKGMISEELSMLRSPTGDAQEPRQSLSLITTYNLALKPGCNEEGGMLHQHCICMAGGKVSGVRTERK